jgi:hypothetical protein
MSYIGLEPSNSFVSLKRQVITGNGGTSYTLDHSVASVNDVAIFVNNVRQDPAGYSISGAALTLGGTIESSDDCYVIFLGQALQTVTPDANTITTAMIQNNAVTTAKITDANVTSAKMFSGFANGITMADQWRLTAELTGNQEPISSNLERVNNTGQGTIGTGMTESSGIFTFPSTGTYLVTFNANFRRGFSDSIVNVVIEATTDNSSYVNVSSGYNNASTTTSGYNNVETKALINVTDISNVKVRFEFGSAESGSNNHFIHGSTGINSTLFTFIRLGDST